jgi:hypothetical protein
VNGIGFTSAAVISIDATAFGDGNTASKTVIVSAVSTTASNELLLAFVGADVSTSSGTNNNVTSVTGGGLTWSLVARTNTQRGTAEIWRAFAATTLSNVTVTANLAISAVSSMTVMSFKGVNTSGTNGSGAIGAIGSGNGLLGAPISNLVTTATNSLVIGVAEDWNADPAVTPGTNQAIVHQLYVANINTFWVQRQNAAIAAPGANVQINDTAPTTAQYNLTVCEILAQ